MAAAGGIADEMLLSTICANWPASQAPSGCDGVSAEHARCSTASGARLSDPAARCEGRRIETIESLGETGAELSQQAFHENSNAVRYCTRA